MGFKNQAQGLEILGSAFTQDTIFSAQNSDFFFCV
ncbi:rCG45932 [Rattus norvegicus]|uniref:RCG45932 n=1 Tax=Rattus norvegicus TaxID=10116 RepID=A6IC86_RAT|nr:rCG45932 [Rattus norvegicus]